MINGTLNLTEMYINPIGSYTPQEIISNYCMQVSSYLITILIFSLFFICYRSDIKQHVKDFCDWIKPKVKNPKGKKLLSEFPQSIEDSLGFIAFTGVGIIIYLYHYMISIPQYIFLGILFAILLFNRILGLAQWIILKYAEKQMQNLSKNFNISDLMKNIPTDDLKEYDILGNDDQDEENDKRN